MSQRGLSDHSRLPFYLLLLWIVLLPWPLGANRDWIWPWFSAALLLVAALATWTVDVPARWRMAHPSLRLALLCLLLVTLCDTTRVYLGSAADDAIWRIADPDAAVLGALKSCTLSALVFASMLLLSSRRRARWLLVGMFASGVAVALLALTITLGGLLLPWMGHRLGGSELATGTYINRNHFAGMLELAGAVGFGLLASGLRATERAGSWREWARRIGHALLGSRFAVRAGLAVLVVALVLTRSRMGNAAFFIGLTAAGVASLIWWRPLPRILIWLLLSIIVIDVLVLGAWVGVDKLAKRVAETHLVAVSPEVVPSAGLLPQPAATTPAAVEPNDAERWTVAKAGLQLWRQRPWFGHGPGSFRLLFPAVKPESVGLFYEHAHNDYVQTLVERGLVGLALFLIAAGSLLVAALQTLRLRNDSLARGLALATIAASVAFGLHSLVDFNLQIPANLFWFQVCLLLGALSHALPVPRPVDRKQPGRSPDCEAVHD